MNANSFERILVPTDMSEFGDLAFRYAMLFHERLQSNVTLLYAEEFSNLGLPDLPFSYYLENAPEAKMRLLTKLRKYADDHGPKGGHVETMVVDNAPAPAVVATADLIHADLIIMGSHGRHGLKRAILGSVTEEVLRQTDRPVMTVVPSQHRAGPTAIKTILCPVNFTDIARVALEQAAAMALAFDADLVVMHVSEVGASPSLVQLEFGAWVDSLVRARTRYRQIGVHGDAAARVLEVADDIGADLVVIGAQHKFFSDATIIGTTTERITRFARQPVLTVVRGAGAAHMKSVA
jgi:nucleotide-binding universal stress UspA family protein